MNAIILAAGSGTRLRPHTDTRPKCMVEVAGVPMLHIQLAVMRRCGIRQIAVVGGYRMDRLEAGAGVTLLSNPDFAATNMVWSLARALPAMTDDFVVSYGDIVYPPSVLQRLMEGGEDIRVAVDLDWRSYWSRRFDNVLSDAETLAMDPDGYLTDIGGKPDSLQGIQGQYIGLMRFRAAGADTLRHLLAGLDRSASINGRPAAEAYMTDLLQSMIASGVRVAAAPFAAPWCEVDSPADLDIAQTRARGWIAQLFDPRGA